MLFFDLIVTFLVAPAAASVISLFGMKRTGYIAALVASLTDLFLSALLIFSGVTLKSGLFFVDTTTKFILLTISMVYLTSSIYSSFYIKRIKEPLIRFRWYYSLLNLFVFTMLFSVLVNNVGLLWIGIEATTVTSALLVALEKEKTSIEAAWRYTIIVSAGLVASLISVLFIYYAEQTLVLSTLLSTHVSNPAVLALASGLAVVGYGTKAGIAPVHTWLPDAHSEAPSPISAMFSGILLPTALYAVYRNLSIINDTAYFHVARDFSIGIGVLTALLASLIIGSQRNYKRMLAYSSMENMGIILTGLALGGIGLVGSIVQIISHALAKSAAFYAAGNILVNLNSKKISEVSGVATKLRYSGYIFLLSCLAVSGAPPFGVFIGEFLIIIAAIQTEYYLVAALLFVSILLTFVNLNRLAVLIVFGMGQQSSNLEFVKEEASSVIVPAVNLILSMILGIITVGVLVSPFLG
ncbi:MAG: proton-conducting transporter membrane subunit [Conexivisphaerales archaeon]